MIHKLRHKLFAERFNGKVYGCGLKREKKKDERDFELGWGSSYTPLKQVNIIPPLEIKDQNYNTCTQESATGCVEDNEKVILSEENLSIFARQAGVISQDGLSSLTAIAKVVCSKGIAEKKLLNKDDKLMSYESYTNSNLLTKEIIENALLHKQKNYAKVVGRSARLKSIDEGKSLFTGMDWYSGFNVSGGFAYPWIIRKFMGWKVGGHAIKCCGYDIPNNVYVFPNSYGKDWGGYVDSTGKKWPGCFAIDMDFYDKYGFEMYQFIDLEENVEELIKKYEGKDVKGSTNGIYRIENGKKRPFPDKLTFYAYGGKFGADKTYQLIAQSLLDRIPQGEDMNVEQSPLWTILKDNWEAIKVLAEPDNLKKVDEVLKSNGYQPKSLWERLNSWLFKK